MQFDPWRIAILVVLESLQVHNANEFLVSHRPNAFLADHRTTIRGWLANPPSIADVRRPLAHPVLRTLGRRRRQHDSLAESCVLRRSSRFRQLDGSAAGGGLAYFFSPIRVLLF